MDYLAVINKFYPEENALKHILLAHSMSVALKALRIVDAHPELQVDRRFVEEAAMIHDIGIFRCDAPGIHCHGTEPYICHGRIGADLLRAEGYPRHARVCERHTGAGISLQEVVEKHLPFPPQDYRPETLEEQIVCYADKFFSKTHLNREKTIEQAEQSLVKYGQEGLDRFRHWEEIFRL